MSDPRFEPGLAKSWRRWIGEALAGGCEPRAIAEALVTEGVDEALVVREVAIVRDAIAPIIDAQRRRELLVRMFATVSAGPIERAPLCSAEQFHARHFTRYRPVLFPGGCAAMKAARWTFLELRERHGEVELELGYPNRTTMKLRDAIDAFTTDAPPELYVTSHNRALAGPLAMLRADLEPLPDFLDPGNAPLTANMWMGPAGTDSPLHHDTTHVWFCQFVGRKRYQLVAPWEPEILRAPIVADWDSRFDVDNPGDVTVHDVVLEPGDALYIPTGWWHRVVALTPSISVSMRDFRWDTNHCWYAPGRPHPR
jgi:hypothetical protein